MKYLSTLAAFWQWFEEKNRQAVFQVKPIEFSSLQKWSFDAKTGNLGHDSGKFFSIQGLRVKTNWGEVATWDQPIIVQPEVGILGIITKVEKNERYFLMQAKMEPGNINLLQLSPTVQATKSNYTRVHQGKLPLFLEYFLAPNKHGARILSDSLQPEQGARFFKKQNRNVILEIDHDLPEHDDFRWMKLSHIKKLMRYPHIINMDARTVISCLVTEAADVSEVLSWLQAQRKKTTLSSRLIALNKVKKWERTADQIKHESGLHFSVMAVEVEAGTREVVMWSQPILKAPGIGLIGFITHQGRYLVQAKLEPGNRQKLDIAPTISFSNYRQRMETGPLPAFLKDFLQAKSSDIQFDTLLSEEGGRFYQAQNRYMIIETKPTHVPDNFTWVSFGQLQSLIQKSVVNVEARSLVATL